MSNKVTKYDLASRLVEREVIYCVSALMGDLRDAVSEGCHALQEYEEDINNLMETTDYEAPGQQHIDQADAGELQEAVELFDGDWDVVLVENGFPTQDMLDEAISSFNQDISDLEGEEELSPEDDEKLARLQAERNALPEDLDEARLCRAWIVIRADGARLGFTDHDRDLVVDGVACRASGDGLRLRRLTTPISADRKSVV